MLLIIFFLKSNVGHNFEPVVFQKDTKNMSGICLPDRLDLYDLKLGSCSLTKTWFASSNNGSTTIDNFLNARFFPALKAFHESEKKTFSMEKSAIAFKENTIEACDFKNIKPNYQVLCTNREGFEKLMKLKSAELISKGIKNYQPLKKNLFGYYYADKTISNYLKRREHWNESFTQYVDIKKESYNVGSKSYSLEDFTKNNHEDFFNGFYKNSAAVFLQAARDCEQNIGSGPMNYAEKLLTRPLKNKKDLEEFNSVACKYYNPDYIEKFRAGYLKTIFVDSCIKGKTLWLEQDKTSSGEIKENQPKTKKVTPSPKKEVVKVPVKTSSGKSTSTLEIPGNILMPPVYVEDYYNNKEAAVSPSEEMEKRASENRQAREKLLKANNLQELNNAKNEYKKVIEKEKQLRFNDADKASGSEWKDGTPNRKALEEYYQRYEQAIDNFKRFQELDT